MADEQKERESSSQGKPAVIIPPEEVFQRRARFSRTSSVALLCLLSTVLMTGCFILLGGGFRFVAYFALVPWVFAVGGGKRTRRTLAWGWFAGVLFWAINLWWLWWITLPGYAALVLYLSIYWLIAGAILRAACRRNWPMWLCLPIVWVATEYARAWIISGFPWFFLAHSQYTQSRLIQICDVTGQYGISFFVAMVNGVGVDLLAGPLFIRKADGTIALFKHGVVGVVVSCVVGAALVGYGAFRLNQEDVLEKGPVLGIVQQAFPISLYEPSTPPDKIFHEHVLSSQRFVEEKCDLVIWPETMLPPWLNPEYVDVDPLEVSVNDLRAAVGHSVRISETMGFEQLIELWRIFWLGKFLPDGLQNVPASDATISQLRSRVGWFGIRVKDLSREQLEAYWEGMRQGIWPDGGRVRGLREYREDITKLVKQLDCPLLAGGTTLHRNSKHTRQEDRWQRRNSALWFDVEGKVSGIYSKRRLVPFSESVPFEESVPWAYGILRSVVPDVMPQMYPGEEWTRFTLQRDGKSWTLGAPICFEGTFARACRAMVSEDGQKKVDILANLSNDGWFVWKYADRPYRGSSEHPQHLIQYCFRAIENRVPVVRAVNTGISASIDSNGRIVAKVQRDGQTMMAGTLLLSDSAGKKGNEQQGGHMTGPQVLVDRRVSLYSNVGDVFAQAVTIAAIGMTVVLIVRRKRKNEARKCR